MSARVVGLVTCALLLVGCSGPASPGPSPSQTNSRVPGSSPPFSAARTEPAVVSCGTAVLDQAEKWPAGAAGCIRDASAAKRPARLRITSPSVEGDPIIVTFEAGTDGRVTVTTDASQGVIFPGGVDQMTCSGPKVTGGELDFARCTQSEPTVGL